MGIEDFVKRVGVAETCILSLIRAVKHDKQAACCAAYAFLDEYAAGAPDIPLLEGRTRDDAKIWAACASPHELEAYLVAAIKELDNSAVLVTQLKRLAALTFNRMGTKDREKFRSWISTQ